MEVKEATVEEEVKGLGMDREAMIRVADMSKAMAMAQRQDMKVLQEGARGTTAPLDMVRCVAILSRFEGLHKDLAAAISV